MSGLKRVQFSIEEARLELELIKDLSFQQCKNLFWYLDQGMLPEPELLLLIKRVLRKGDTAIDVGACIGFFSLVMAQFCNSVIAVEPDGRNSEKLRQHIKLNNLQNIDVYCKAAWWDDCQLPFTRTEDSGENYISDIRMLKEDSNTAFVDAVRLDNIWKAVIPEMIPRLVKIDAEGSELWALMGCSNWLHHVPFVVCEYNAEALQRQKIEFHQLRDYMEGGGFSTFMLIDNCIPVFIPPKTMILPGRLNANILFSTLDAISEAWPEVALS